MCKGNCPGTGSGGEWRKRSESCAIWKALFLYFEDNLINNNYKPISDFPFLRTQLEALLIKKWASGSNSNISSLLKEIKHTSIDINSVLSNLQCNKTAKKFGRDSLSFLLPDFTRTTWIGYGTKKTWEEKISRINKAFFNIEWQSVVFGIRKCSLNTVNPYDLINISSQLAKHKLSFLPLNMEAISSYRYSTRTKLAKPGERFNYRIVIGKLDDLVDFKIAWDRKNLDLIGEMLGYPLCCVNFFKKIWIKSNFVDTTWPMATNSIVKGGNDYTIELSENVYTNMLWRWLGIRFVPHLPCSFNCESTKILGQSFYEVGLKCNYTSEMNWLLEILSWPVQWSALNGIAEIKTPILKISTFTDASSKKFTVNYNGTGYPIEGASGDKFPWRNTKSNYKVKSDLINEEWFYKDNGFVSKEAMIKSQRPLIDLILTDVGNRKANIIDFGCGNGILLSKIIRLNKNIIPYGIDKSQLSIYHLQYILPQFRNNFLCEDMFSSTYNWVFDNNLTIAILMIGRLLEVNEKKTKALVDFLKKNCIKVLVYSYDDWHHNWDSFFKLIRKENFKFKRHEFINNAGFIDFS